MESPSLPQVRQALKTLLASERDDGRRKEIGRALAAVDRASKTKDVDREKRP